MRVLSTGSAELSMLSAARTRARRSCHLMVALAVSGLLSTGQVVAQEAQEPASAEASGSPTKDRKGKICQYEEVTGSRMKKRVCHPPEQWEAREKAAKDMVRELDAKPVAEHHGE